MPVQVPFFRSIFLLFLFVIPLTSCETVANELLSILTEEIGDCIHSISPKLPKKEMFQGKINDSYADLITAYVTNADEENFEYAFYLEGELAKGMKYRSDGRVFEIYGIPKEAGTFTFTLKVELLDVITGAGDGFCFGKKKDLQSYTITIVP